jgi:hypothetical protein
MNFAFLNNKYVKVGLGAVAGGLIGALVGVAVAKRLEGMEMEEETNSSDSNMPEEEENNDAEDEDSSSSLVVEQSPPVLQNTRHVIIDYTAAYARARTEKPMTPEEYAQKYSQVQRTPIETMVTKNIWNTPQETTNEEMVDVGPTTKITDPLAPRVIDMDEYAMDHPKHTYHALKYYHQDDVLIDERGNPISNPDKLLGPDALVSFEAEGETIYVVNPQLRGLYEIESMSGPYFMRERDARTKSRKVATLEEEEDDNV